MSNFNELIPNNSGNFIFIGEAGSGKSEIAINFAIDLAANSNKSIHFFDMDMTKALFRSRDLSEKLINLGIKVHYQEQYMDAPTLVGGVNRLLKDEDSIVIMDIGGDYIGARSIGGFAPLLNKDNTVIYYVPVSYTHLPAAKQCLLDDEMIKRAYKIGQNIMKSLNTPVKERKWLGEEDMGWCPNCHSNALVLGEVQWDGLHFPVECQVCGAGGNLEKSETGKWKFVIQEDGLCRDRTTVEGREEHLKEIMHTQGGFLSLIHI